MYAYLLSFLIVLNTIFIPVLSNNDNNNSSVVNSVDQNISDITIILTYTLFGQERGVGEGVTVTIYRVNTFLILADETNQFSAANFSNIPYSSYLVGAEFLVWKCHDYFIVNQPTQAFHLKCRFPIRFPFLQR